MSDRLPFEPPDPRLLAAPPGELFRRQFQVRQLLQRASGAAAERRAELEQAILVYGLAALPAARAAVRSRDPSVAALGRSVLGALTPEEVGQQLAAGLMQDENGYPLELGATLLARLGDPLLALAPVLKQIDLLGRKAERFISEALQAPVNRRLLDQKLLDVVVQLGEFWRKEGFQGNIEDYYDVRNSWLPHALEHHTGLPIVLSILYLALCRRLGVQAEGVGLPWHFIVRIEVALKTAPGYVFIDPFHGARPLDLDDCRKLVESSGQSFDPGEHLRPLTPREVLLRMCNNLLAAYDQHKEARAAEGVATVLVHLGPQNPAPFLIRAERRLRRGAYRDARMDLHTMLLLDPPPPLAQAALALLRQIDYEHPF